MDPESPVEASPSSGMSFIAISCAFDASEDLTGYLESLSSEDLTSLLSHWPLRCLRPQVPPGSDRSWRRGWTIGLVLGGRGAGKTRTGAEWVRGIVQAEPGFDEPGIGQIALVGETFANARDVMVEGPSGILEVHARGERPVWSPSLRKLEWPNGAVAHVFSAEDPDALRGLQFEAAWCDELAKWRHAEETWDMLQFGLRLGLRPREMITTTPRPIPLLRRPKQRHAVKDFFHSCRSHPRIGRRAIERKPGGRDGRRPPLRARLRFSPHRAGAARDVRDVRRRRDAAVAGADAGLPSSQGAWNRPGANRHPAPRAAGKHVDHHQAGVAGSDLHPLRCGRRARQAGCAQHGNSQKNQAEHRLLLVDPIRS